MTESQKIFIEKVYASLPDDMGGLFPSVLIAQAILESGWGKSTLASKYNNLFGIKVSAGWSGPGVNLKTNEIFDGVETTVTSAFRVYDNWKQSIADRNKFLRENPRYTKAGVFTATDPLEQIKALKQAGYATAENYVDSLLNIVQLYDLQKFDIKKK